MKKLEELEKNAGLYKGLIEHTKRLLKAHFHLAKIHKEFGDIFAEIGVREPQPAACEAFTIFGEAHRNMEKNGVKLLKILKPVSEFSVVLIRVLKQTLMAFCRFSPIFIHT